MESPPAPTLRGLVDLVARLRAPDGCPWDREQGLAEVRPYLLEEAHELAAAIDEGDAAAIAGELGDLLFQAAFVARLGEEAGTWSAEGVVAAEIAKMIDRHPHVFGDETLPDAAAVARAWETRKAAAVDGSLLAGVPASLPALVGAYRLAQKAAGVGFDWPDAAAVLAKVDEELAELSAEIAAAEPDTARCREEVGDLLFAVASLARHLGIEPEAALAGANAKFRRRFGAVEEGVRRRGARLGEVPLVQLEELWQEAKETE